MPSSGRSRSMMARMARLAALVGFGDGIEGAAARLVRHFDALAEIGPDHRARGIGQAMGEGDQLFVDGHVAFQKETIDPPATIRMPPARMGMVGGARKKTKLMICHITNRMAM